MICLRLAGLVTFATAATLGGACGAPSTNSSSDSATETSPPVSGAAQTKAAGDVCDALTFTDTEPFTAHDSLFFDFEHPAGWIHTPANDGMSGHGGIHPADNNRIGIEYVLMPVPMRPEMSNQIRETAMEPWETIDYAGGSIQVWENRFPDVGTITVGINLPFEEAHYDVNFFVREPRECDLSSADAVRSLVVGSIAPATDTTFQPGL